MSVSGELIHQVGAASNRPRPTGKVVEELEERIVGYRLEEMLAVDEPREPLLDDLEERIEGVKDCILAPVRHGRLPNVSSVASDERGEYRLDICLPAPQRMAVLPGHPARVDAVGELLKQARPLGGHAGGQQGGGHRIAMPPATSRARRSASAPFLTEAESLVSTGSSTSSRGVRSRKMTWFSCTTGSQPPVT